MTDVQDTLGGGLVSYSFLGFLLIRSLRRRMEQRLNTSPHSFETRPLKRKLRWLDLMDPRLRLLFLCNRRSRKRRRR